MKNALTVIAGVFVALVLIGVLFGEDESTTTPPPEPELTQAEQDEQDARASLDALAGAHADRDAQQVCALLAKPFHDTARKYGVTCVQGQRTLFRIDPASTRNSARMNRGVKRIVVKGDVATVNYYGGQYRRLVRAPNGDWKLWPAGVPIKERTAGGYSA